MWIGILATLGKLAMAGIRVVVVSGAASHGCMGLLDDVGNELEEMICGAHILVFAVVKGQGKRFEPRDVRPRVTTRAERAKYAPTAVRSHDLARSV